MTDKKHTNDDQWLDKLTPEQFSMCRLKGSERPFTGKDTDRRKTGI